MKPIDGLRNKNVVCRAHLKCSRLRVAIAADKQPVTTYFSCDPHSFYRDRGFSAPIPDASIAIETLSSATEASSIAIPQYRGGCLLLSLWERLGEDPDFVGIATGPILIFAKQEL